MGLRLIATLYIETWLDTQQSERLAYEKSYRERFSVREVGRKLFGVCFCCTLVASFVIGTHRDGERRILMKAFCWLYTHNHKTHIFFTRSLLSVCVCFVLFFGNVSKRCVVVVWCILWLPQRKCWRSFQKACISWIGIIWESGRVERRCIQRRGEYYIVCISCFGGRSPYSYPSCWLALCGSVVLFSSCRFLMHKTVRFESLSSQSTSDRDARRTNGQLANKMYHVSSHDDWYFRLLIVN